MRFVANCKMHIDGKLKEVEVRWATNGQWQTQKDVWIGVVSNCWISTADTTDAGNGARA